MHGPHNEIAPDSYIKNTTKKCINLKQAEIHYANLNFKSKAHLGSAEEVQYAALDFHSENNSNRLQNNFPKAAEIILDPSTCSNALKNSNGGRGNNIITGTTSVNNQNTQIQRKQIRTCLISLAVVCVCVIACLAAVILWPTRINISEKGNNKKNGIYQTRNPKTMDQKQACVAPGPFRGSKGGSPFSDRDMTKHGNISGLYIMHNRFVSCVGFIRTNSKYYCFGGESDDVYKVSFKTGEYITGVEGTTGPFIEDRSFDLLSQITFITNLGRYGPYGEAYGNQFSIDFKGRRLVYISGRSGLSVDEITFHLDC